MTNPHQRDAIPFRINFEQQKKRAKELLRAIKNEHPEALSRLASHHSQFQLPFSAARLADAQFVIARELGVPSWAKLKQHIADMSAAQESINTQSQGPDSDLATLHIRCGSDIERTLTLAGFEGVFFEHRDPVCQGPLAQDDYFAVRADFIAKAYGELANLDRKQIYDDLIQREQQFESVANFQRVVLWFEHDTYDQFILIKLLDTLARYPLPAVLEIVTLNQFPGSERFIGLGQLPPEAIHLLWSKRQAVSAQHLALGQRAWQALSSSTPEPLQQLMHDPECAVLPHLSKAIHRHLQEFPSLENGLGLTEQLSLETLVDGPRTCGQVFRELMTEREPMPWLGDMMFWYIFKRLAEGSQPLLVIDSSNSADWPQYKASLTALGLSVLQGKHIYTSEQWLGGVHIPPGVSSWCWDESSARVLPAA